MKIAFFVVIWLMLAGLACDQLSLGGKCYDDDGDELTHVFDADGTRWNIEKETLDGLDYCAIPRKAQPFETPAGILLIYDVEHPSGYQMGLLGRHQDKWLINPVWAEWY